MITQSRPLLGDGGEWIFNAIKRNPEGLLLLAAGAVLMMRASSSPIFSSGVYRRHVWSYSECGQ